MEEAKPAVIVVENVPETCSGVLVEESGDTRWRRGVGEGLKGLGMRVPSPFSVP